jgi:uncharacterized protein (DUF2141 family)
MRNFFISIISIYFILLICIGQVGCGQMAAPMGGPRDSLPPVLVKSNPINEQLNFKETKIVLEFDEYVQLDNAFQNMIVSPLPKRQPVVESKLRVVTVRLRDSLDANTTYTIDFGKSIKDVNEGNIAQNLKYVFSTGNYLDSLTLYGKVVNAETGKPDSTYIVVLHLNSEDSAVIKEFPRYYTPLNKDGVFKFERLPAAEYSIYAMKDEGGQRKYLSNSQAFAFYDERVNTTTQTDSIYLFAYIEPDAETDEEQDDIFSNISNQNKSKEKEAALKNFLVINTNVAGGKQDLLEPLVLESKQAPFKMVDTSKIVLYGADSTPVKGVRFELDTNMTKVTLRNNWIPDHSYYLILDSTFATDTLNMSLKQNDTLSFYSKKESEYGLVRLRFKNLALDKNPILQFISNNKVVYEKTLTGTEFFAKLFQPGEYELRLVYDENKNGKWDPGNFFGEKRQPEKVYAIPVKAAVRANWECELDIEL